MTSARSSVGRQPKRVTETIHTVVPFTREIAEVERQFEVVARAWYREQRDTGTPKRDLMEIGRTDFNLADHIIRYVRMRVYNTAYVGPWSSFLVAAIKERGRKKAA